MSLSTNNKAAAFPCPAFPYLSVREMNCDLTPDSEWGWNICTIDMPQSCSGGGRIVLFIWFTQNFRSMSVPFIIPRAHPKDSKSSCSFSVLTLVEFLSPLFAKILQPSQFVIMVFGYRILHPNNTVSVFDYWEGYKIYIGECTFSKETVTLRSVVVMCEPCWTTVLFFFGYRTWCLWKIYHLNE